ncbi:MAG: helix-turn-helix transcriptional regulator [candidate division Zixibacteria bacterium]|nr:helix-turn-helix transcriptional regulator [candidate division Zixibacteria bacterium]
MKKKTTDAVQILHDRFYKGKPKRQAALDRERVNAKIARDIYALRIKGGLTQKELARMVKTTPSVISRLESADYPGHSLNMLQRVAAALNQRVEVHFVPTKVKSRGPVTARDHLI